MFIIISLEKKTTSWRRHSMNAAFILCVSALLCSCDFIKFGPKDKSVTGEPAPETPVYSWTRTISNQAGSEKDIYPNIKVGADGSIYKFGYFIETVNFSLNNEPNTITSSGGKDAYIMRINPDGTQAWIKTFGGMGEDVIAGIDFDQHGNIIAVGKFSDTVNFDLSGAGSPDFSATAISYYDAFMLKLSDEGETLSLKIIEGSANARLTAADVNVSNDNSIFITGSLCNEADFDPGTGVQKLSATGCDAFLVKLNPDEQFDWAKIVGGASYDWGIHTRTDSAGNVYMLVSNLYQPIFIGEEEFTNSGGSDNFLISYSSDGAYRWGQLIGGSAWEGAGGLHIDGENNIILTGAFADSIDFNQSGSGSPDVRTSKGERDVYITKLSNTGAYLWTRTFGTVGGDGSGIGVDTSYGPISNYSFDVNSDGDVYMGIAFKDPFTDLSPLEGDFAHTMLGTSDIAILKLSKDNGDTLTAKQLGGAGAELTGPSIRYHAFTNDILLYGQFKGENIDFNVVNDDSKDLHSSNDPDTNDVFLTKLEF